MSQRTAIALLSGGLDSATAAALALEQGDRVIGLSFDYGQRHRRELDAAAAVAEQLGLAEHHCISVNLASWGGSALTDARISIPTHGVEEGSIPHTYVDPNFSTALLRKDLRLFLEEATTAGLQDQGLSGLLSLLEQAEGTDLDEQDYCALHELTVLK